MTDLFDDNIFFELEDFLPSATVFLKLESYNVGGSIKMKTAVALFEHLEQTGQLGPTRVLIESSSGNLGIALAILCARIGLSFICVIDPNSSQSSRQIIQSYGARLVVCDHRDANAGFLQSRIDLVKQMCKADPRLVWPNQYANPANVEVHYKWTAPAILKNHPDVTAIFVGAGTTGTLMGCARYVREYAPTVRVVPVDSVGSVIFGHPPGIRYIPGMGSSRVPEIFDRSLVEEALLVSEIESIRMCRLVASRYGILIGGSTGTVLAGLAQSFRSQGYLKKVVVISPDSGERYLDTIFDDSWVKRRFPDFTLRSALDPEAQFASLAQSGTSR